MSLLFITYIHMYFDIEKFLIPTNNTGLHIVSHISYIIQEKYYKEKHGSNRLTKISAL